MIGNSPVEYRGELGQVWLDQVLEIEDAHRSGERMAQLGIQLFLLGTVLLFVQTLLAFDVAILGGWIRSREVELMGAAAAFLSVAYIAWSQMSRRRQVIRGELRCMMLEAQRYNALNETNNS